MFIQIIQGKCTRHDELRAAAKGWRSELSEGAVGWLGGTYGFTDDDQFIGVVRFESREAATANSARPEQGAWADVDPVSGATWKLGADTSLLTGLRLNRDKVAYTIVDHGSGFSSANLARTWRPSLFKDGPIVVILPGALATTRTTAMAPMRRSAAP